MPTSKDTELKKNVTAATMHHENRATGPESVSIGLSTIIYPATKLASKKTLDESKNASIVSNVR